MLARNIAGMKSLQVALTNEFNRNKGSLITLTINMSITVGRIILLKVRRTLRYQTYLQV